MELRIGLSYSSTRKHRLSYLGSLKPPADSNRWLGTPSKALHPNTPIIISNSDRHFSSRGVMLQNWRSFCTWSNCLIVFISPQIVTCYAYPPPPPNVLNRDWYIVYISVGTLSQWVWYDVHKTSPTNLVYSCLDGLCSPNALSLTQTLICHPHC